MGKWDVIWESNRRSKVRFLFVLLALDSSKSITELANRVGVSRQAVYGWKTGAYPSYENLVATSKYLGVPIPAMFEKMRFCEHLRTIKTEDQQQQESINALIELICK